MNKSKVAKTIERFLKKHDLDSDVRIYFSGKAWDYDSSGKKSVIEDVKASEYFDYANDDTISMSFEGGLYDVLNMSYGGDELFEEFNALDFDGHFFELGNAWNLSFYE